MGLLSAVERGESSSFPLQTSSPGAGAVVLEKCSEDGLARVDSVEDGVQHPHRAVHFIQRRTKSPLLVFQRDVEWVLVVDPAVVGGGWCAIKRRRAAAAAAAAAVRASQYRHCSCKSSLVHRLVLMYESSY